MSTPTRATAHAVSSALHWCFPSWRWLLATLTVEVLCLVALMPVQVHVALAAALHLVAVAFRRRK
jgi:hypothetical protein